MYLRASFTQEVLHMLTKVRLLRLQRGFSQRQVSQLSGLQESVISLIENNRLNANASERDKIARVLGYTELEVFGDEE